MNLLNYVAFGIEDKPGSSDDVALFFGVIVVPAVFLLGIGFLIYKLLGKYSNNPTNEMKLSTTSKIILTMFILLVLALLFSSVW